MAEEEGQKLSGAQKSAILLLAMGEEAAVQVMRNMRDDEVSQIGEAAAGLSGLDARPPPSMFSKSLLRLLVRASTSRAPTSTSTA